VAGSAVRGGKVAAESLPVARVAVDVSLPHLDRPFDYLVPEKLSAAAVPGCRVRVRFAGRLTGGYLLQRVDKSEHEGGLAFLERVVSPEPVLTAEMFGLARAVADRYGGTLADVLRLAIPPRHAAAEAAAVGGGVSAGAVAEAAAVGGGAAAAVGAPSSQPLDARVDGQVGSTPSKERTVHRVGDMGRVDGVGRRPQRLGGDLAAEDVGAAAVLRCPAAPHVGSHLLEIEDLV